MRIINWKHMNKKKERNVFVNIVYDVAQLNINLALIVRYKKSKIIFS